LLIVLTTDHLLMKCSCKFTFVQWFLTLTPFTYYSFSLISQCTCFLFGNFIINTSLAWKYSISWNKTEGYLLIWDMCIKMDLFSSFWPAKPTTLWIYNTFVSDFWWAYTRVGLYTGGGGGGGAYTWTIFCVSNKQVRHKQENKHVLSSDYWAYINSGDLYLVGLYSGGLIFGGLIFGVSWALAHVVGLYTGGGLIFWGLIVGGLRYFTII
jgi:hypothetical protein